MQHYPTSAKMTQTQTSILDRLAKKQPGAPSVILVAGATGGIGQAFCKAISQQFPSAILIRLCRNPERLVTLPNQCIDLAFDLLDENSISKAVQQLPQDNNIDWIFIATGWLHDQHYQPEKTCRALAAEHLQQAFALNSIGPALLVQALVARQGKHPLKIGILSARVGSISDNRLGGWYSYRASKAALNMLIKNFAIEFERMRKPWIIVGLQPGTTDTRLSKPYQRGVSPEHLQTPEYTAEQLAKVLMALEPEDSGNLFDFLGLSFAP